MTTSHVLARKYRPQTFNDLIGQEALVRTVSNAIKQNRLPNAYMLTGIRGIGKTTSARIIAKGLNCIGIDGKGEMTPNPCGQCKHCREIAADSHIDVIEIDAASNTGVDNVREIIEGAKYNPVSARYKIYIIDEVHMLSKAAFNALLKTLEEPPERIKFIFATTEIRKVPVTILSRCQRFDLKRVDENVLSAYLKQIAERENAVVEPEALQLIARAGEGSVRDSLSLLDQALTQFDMSVKAENVRQMMGLSDKSALLDLYEALLQGEIEKALNFLQMQCQIGADSVALVQDMLDLTHWLTRVKITPSVADDVSMPENVRKRGAETAKTLSMGTLSVVWQILLKGLDEVRRADNPWQTLEMLLIRLAYTAELPSPAQLVEEIKKKGISTDSVKPNPAPVHLTPTQIETTFVPVQPMPQVTHPAVPPETTSEQKPLVQPITASLNTTPPQSHVPDSQFHSFAEMVAFIKKSGERLLAYHLENYLRVESLENLTLTCLILPEAPAHLGADLIKFLKTKANEDWRIQQKSDITAETLTEKKAARHNQLVEELSQEPVIAQTLALFPKSKIKRIRQNIELTESEE